MCAQKVTIWPAYSSTQHQNKKIKAKLKTTTDYLRGNGAGKKTVRAKMLISINSSLRQQYHTVTVTVYNHYTISLSFMH